MTLNWNTLTPLPKAVTEFGQPRLDDYGQDDLSPYFDFADWGTSDRLDFDLRQLLGEGEVSTSVQTKTKTQIVAVLDWNEPAMLVEDGPLTRMHDFQEDGMVWWIGAEATVGCPVEMKTSVGNAASRGGWHARVGNFPSECGFVVMPHNPTLPDAPVNRNREQYALWSLLRSTVLVDA